MTGAHRTRACPSSVGMWPLDLRQQQQDGDISSPRAVLSLSLSLSLSSSTPSFPPAPPRAHPLSLPGFLGDSLTLLALGHHFQDPTAEVVSLVEDNPEVGSFRDWLLDHHKDCRARSRSDFGFRHVVLDTFPAVFRLDETTLTKLIGLPPHRLL